MLQLLCYSCRVTVDVRVKPSEESCCVTFDVRVKPSEESCCVTVAVLRLMCG